MQSVRRTAFSLLAVALLWLVAVPVVGAQEALSGPPVASGPGTLIPGPDPGESVACTPVIGVDPDPVAFGDVPVGETSTLDVQITDLESDTECGITISSIELTVGSGFFEILGLPTLPQTFPAGVPFTFQVRFAPPQAGQLNGVMTITSDDPVTPVKEVNLNGRGTAGNQPPTCNADGPYVGVVGVAVSFDGSGSEDPDGTITSYEWDFGDGSSGTGVSPTHVYATEGTFTVTLTVTDDGSPPLNSECSSSASITGGTADTITVTAPNGAEEFAPGDVTSVTWESEGDILFVDIELSLDGGTSYEAIGVSEENDGSFAWTVSNTPTENALIRVKDATDGVPSDVSDAPFTINGVILTRPNGGETLRIGDTENIIWDVFGTLTTTVRLELSTDGGFSFTDIVASTDNDALYEWTVAGNPTVEALVRITDTGNALATDTSDAVFTIAEQGSNLPPICDAGGPYSALVNTAVSFDGSGSSDPDGTITSYAWDFGDGSSGTGVAPTHTYTTTGTFTVELTVTDDLDAFSTCSATATITGENQAPTCDAGGPYTGTVDIAITFDGTGSSDPDGTITSYAWTFGDGSSATGATPTHAYAAAGSYSVGLTVTDNEGASSTCTTTANVTGGVNLPPDCDAGGSYAGVVGSAINFDGRDSNDPDGNIVSHAWDFGDGSTATGATVSHAYATTGTFTVSLTVTDDDGASSTCTTTAEVGEAPTGVRVALPPRSFGSPGADVAIPVFAIDDLTGLGIIAMEFEIRYNPHVLVAQGLQFAGTIGEGATFEWRVDHRSPSEDILHVAMAWTEPLADCGEIVYVLYQVSPGDANPRTRLEFWALFNEGDPAANAHDGEFIKGRIGDVNGSGQVSAIDATLVLQETVGIIRLPDPSYPYFVLEIADVSGNGEIRAYDAALILQYVLGIIDHFPAEEQYQLACDPGGRHVATRGPETMRTLSLEWVTPTEAALFLDDGAGVIGAEARIAFDSGLAPDIEILTQPGGGVLIESAAGDGYVDLATVIARPTSGRTELARIRFASEVTGARIEKPSLNEGLIPVVITNAPFSGVPGAGAVVLAQNRPNPFNPATEISFSLAVGGRVELAVYDLSGRRVRSLIQGELPAGPHAAQWNGRDDTGAPMAAGVYLYTLDAAGTTTTRKMILLK